METSPHWDFVIVGAGSAGCVLADRLSADGRHQVLLLEAGPEDRSPWIHLPWVCNSPCVTLASSGGFPPSPSPP